MIYMSADFKSPADKLRDLLPTPELQPLESNGQTDVRIFALEYQGWSVGEQSWPPYNEWTLTIPVEYRGEDGTGLGGYYVVWMPVTHEIPMRDGIEGWGFNKFMSDIRFTETKETRTCEVVLNGKKLISFAIRKAETSDNQVDYYVYNEMDGMLTRTLAQFKGGFGTSTGDGSGSIALGDHPLARRIASTDLELNSGNALYGVNVRLNLHAYECTLPL
jgi:hypothetical protein